MKTNHYQIMFSGIGASLLAALSVAAAASPPAPPCSTGTRW